MHRRVFAISSLLTIAWQGIAQQCPEKDHQPKGHGQGGFAAEAAFGFLVRCLTVANVLSIGLLVRMCFQCSAGKS